MSNFTKRGEGGEGGEEEEGEEDGTKWSEGSGGRGQTALWGWPFLSFWEIFN